MSSRTERVFLDTDAERAIGLDCIDVADRRWNGALIPRVHARQVRAFVQRWKEADPNGTWGEVYERPDGALVVTRNDSDDPDDWDTWLPVGHDEHGAIYELEGWMWTR